MITDLSKRTGPDSPPRTLVAVCTLNEAENVVPLVRAIRQAISHADVLVVDDESPDGTASLVQKLQDTDPKVHLEVRRGERGLGGAIRFAMDWAIGRDYEYFINLDGDFSHDPKQLPSLFQRMLQSGDVDVVIGSRYAPGGQIVGWPQRRLLMSRMVNGFAKTCLRLPVRDCSGAMRCYRVTALKRAGTENFRVQGYAILEEILVRLHRQGASMVEVPITFTDRQRGKSKLTLREALRSSLQMVRLAVRS